MCFLFYPQKVDSLWYDFRTQAKYRVNYQYSIWSVKKITFPGEMGKFLHNLNEIRFIPSIQLCACEMQSDYYSNSLNLIINILSWIIPYGDHCSAFSSSNLVGNMNKFGTHIRTKRNTNVGGEPRHTPGRQHVSWKKGGQESAYNN